RGGSPARRAGPPRAGAVGAGRSASVSLQTGAEPAALPRAVPVRDAVGRGPTREAAPGDTAAAVDAGAPRIAGEREHRRGLAPAQARRHGLVDGAAAPVAHVAVGKIGRQVDTNPVANGQRLGAGMKSTADP